MSDRLVLIVGLGNPGSTYEATRHNVGFWAVADLVDRHGASFSLNSRMKAEVATFTRPEAKYVVIRPTTFMNLSGESVGALARFHKIPPADVIVVHDELDLEPSQLRLKLGGGDNGHNGLKSIRAHLGTGDFLRVRVGIGRPPGRMAGADWVLQKLKPKELDQLRFDAAVAADAVEYLVRDGLASAQNRFNS